MKNLKFTAFILIFFCYFHFGFSVSIQAKVREHCMNESKIGWYSGRSIGLLDQTEIWCIKIQEGDVEFAIDHNYGTRIWYKNDKIHRLGAPAMEHKDGTKIWYLNGEIHRLNGPAVERGDEIKYWIYHNKLHRFESYFWGDIDLEKMIYHYHNFCNVIYSNNPPPMAWNLVRRDVEFHCDGCPAIGYPDGTLMWLKYDKLHRIDAPAVKYGDGTQMWYQDDKLHRIDGPAVIYPDGLQMWYQENKLHRIDGPAIEYPDGLQMWFQNGKLHSASGPAIKYYDIMLM